MNRILSSIYDLITIAIVGGGILVFAAEIKLAAGVWSISPSFNCTGKNCTYQIKKGESVTLGVSMEDSISFDGWGEACSGVDTSCKVIMDGDQTVTASFSVTVAESAITVSWTAPTQREEEFEKLEASEIKQYIIYYGPMKDDCQSNLMFMEAEIVVKRTIPTEDVPTQVTIDNLIKDQAYCVAGVTIDTDNLTSQLSNIIVKTAK